MGAKIVMIDVAPGKFELDYDTLADKITENTKAIIPVDIGGKMCDYERIFEVINTKRGLFKPNNDFHRLYNRIIVIADSSHAFGATYDNAKSGNWAAFTTFSFHEDKFYTGLFGAKIA